MSENVPACARCGGDTNIIVEGEPLCDRHRAQWIAQEVRQTNGRIKRVMRALDKVCEEEVDADWNKHLRRMAVAAIEAAA